MIESEIIASGSVKGVLSGKHYNRAMRVHKLLIEPMERYMRLEVFDKSLTTEKKTKLDWFDVILTEDSSFDKFLENCARHSVNEVKEMYDKFVNERSKVNPFLHSGENISKWWSCYYYTHEPHELRTTLRSMIPWFFATDHYMYL